MRLKKPIIALSVVGALALAGCGGGGGDDSDESGNTGDDFEAITGDGKDETAEGPVEIEGAQEGGTVNLISVAGLNTMDPTEAYYQNTWSILSNLVTRSLTQLKYDEETGNMVLVPDLAEDLGKPSEDFKTWTFQLRDGIKYEDGTEVTPEDWKWGICRSFDRTQFPEGAAYSNDYFLDGDTYEGPYTSKDGIDGCTAVEVSDDLELTLKMRKPFPDMAYWGTFPTMGPMPEKASDPAKYARSPLATGPYKFDQYTPEKSLTLVRNDQWDPASDPARTQYPDEYVMDFQVESAKIDQLLLADAPADQATMTYDDVQVASYPKFTSDASDRLSEGTFPLNSYWAPDNRKITDIKVRQALAWAFPYKDAELAAGRIEGVTSIFGGPLMPPGTVGRKDFNPIEGHDFGSTDAAKAKALLEEAGEVGFEIKWPYAKDDPTAVAAMEEVKRALNEAGFKASPVASTVADLSTLRADPDADINVRPAGWIADWATGSSWFPPVIQSTNLKAEGLGSNYAAFADDEVDARIAEIQELPVDEQADAWGELDEQVMTEHLPLFTIRYGGVVQAHGSKVNGHFIDNTIGMPTWKNIWVSQ